MMNSTYLNTRGLIIWNSSHFLSFLGILLMSRILLPYLKQCGENVPITNDMVVGVESLVAPWLIIAKDVIVTVTQTLTSAEFYIDVTNDMLVTVS